jgi:hypothetical protein
MTVTTHSAILVFRGEGNVFVFSYKSSPIRDVIQLRTIFGPRDSFFRNNMTGPKWASEFCRNGHKENI